ncbi:NUDIX domain-containing protein [Actibacterium sp. XHP0104]|uniref:NUDIX domain-containing protein n=1 Tax=Actibacterium sp. XHP0104 TaxID=2984335 RepID=UPI0021E76431|nr:NUDIX domain-containing protein [Actibacterium sp. XHP0104]MCV2880954.1 NUDIX domain-containing protein [Actibacterium sp. XHP0104]
MNLFLWGPLAGGDLLTRVVGGPVETGAGALRGYGLRVAGNGPWPMPWPDAAATLCGLVWCDPSAQGLARLDYYMRGHGFDRVALGQGQETYLADASVVAGAAWDADHWRANWAETTALAAGEVMRHYPARPVEQTMARYPSILSAAASRVMARDGGPTTLRRHAGAADVEVIAQDQPYAGFFSIEDYTLRHIRFDGRMSSPIRRTAFLSTDVVTVLPYDPVRDRVLLVEQFRMGPFARGDRQCWSLEAIAGRCEPGEPPEITARREAEEEAGLTLARLIKVGRYYPTPGAKTEYVHAYLGLADLPDDITGIAGLDAEGEDIRSHLVAYDAVAALLESGEIENAPLILSLHWLSQQRESLRAGA